MRAPMNKRRGGVGVGVANGFLYAFGGHDCPASNPSVKRNETVERYDPATDTWAIIASLNLGRDAIGVALIGGCLIVSFFLLFVLIENNRVFLLFKVCWWI